MKTYLNPEEIAMMENSTTNLRDRILVRLLFHLGCRVSEALGIKKTQIDFHARTVTIQHLKTRENLNCPACNTRLSRSSIFCPGCGKKIWEVVSSSVERRKLRTLPLDEDTIRLLQEYIKRDGPVIKGDKNLIFGINRHRAWQIVKECAEKAGLPKLVNPETGRVHNVSPHKLRDAFAVNAVKVDDSGDGLRLLQEHLGHQNFNTTAKYRKVSGTEHHDWYQRLWEKKH